MSSYEKLRDIIIEYFDLREEGVPKKMRKKTKRMRELKHITLPLVLQFLEMEKIAVLNYSYREGYVFYDSKGSHLNIGWEMLSDDNRELTLQDQSVEFMDNVLYLMNKGNI